MTYRGDTLSHLDTYKQLDEEFKRFESVRDNLRVKGADNKLDCKTFTFEGGYNLSSKMLECLQEALSECMEVITAHACDILRGARADAYTEATREARELLGQLTPAGKK